MGSVALNLDRITRDECLQCAARLGPLTLFPAGREHCAPGKVGHTGVLLALGALTVVQSGRSCTLQSGEWTLLRGDRPHGVDKSAMAQIAYVPEEQFSERGLNVNNLLLHRFTRARSIDRVVFSMFSTIFDEAAGLGPLDESGLAQAGLHVLKQALLDASRPRSAKVVFLGRVREFIEWRIRDPQLSPERIAKGLNCTPRNIHRAFEGAGETLSQYILRRRLERCRDDLRAPEHAERSVTEIAFSWGFNNAAHFSRVFRKQFGCAPSACRGGALLEKPEMAVDAAAMAGQARRHALCGVEA